MLLAPQGGRATRLRSANTAALSVPASEPAAPELAAAQPAVTPAVVESAGDQSAAVQSVVTQPIAAKRARRRGGATTSPALTIVPPQPEERGAVTPKIAEFLDRVQPATPCLVLDLDVVEGNYLGLAASLAPAEIFYAVKANPAPEILRLLAKRGSSFDVASRGEIDLCLEAGIRPERISFGNTIKKQADIAYAYGRGVRLFAFDSEAELEKLAVAAPGATVFCRLLVDGAGAEWPLSKKFGCSFAMAKALLLKAKTLGLDAAGVSFHIGSQQTDLGQWDRVLAAVAALYRELKAEGLEPSLINLGGGFPCRYQRDVPSVGEYGRAVIGAVRRHFGHRLPRLICEPGRGMVGEAGVIESEVVLVSTKELGETTRWVYLDIGKFSGLAETMEEAIKYRLETPHDGGPAGPVVLAGPSCDSADILYEKTAYELPLALKPGDKVRILACGAYTTTYSSVGFNGFAPLKAYCI
jgi:ornithine decarboxylase